MTTQTLPRWQQIAQEKNLDISIVNFSELEAQLRIDPEFYQKKFLINKELIEKHKYAYLYEISEKVTDGTHFTPNYQEAGIKFFSALNVLENHTNFSKYKFISKDEHKILYKRARPEESDILLRKVGVGARFASVVPKVDFEFSIFVSLALVKLKKEYKSWNFYISTFINSKYGQNQLLRFNKGISQPDLHLEDLRELKIPISTKPFQKKISKMVQMAHAEREKSKKLYSEAEEILLSELDLKNWKPTEKNTAVKDSEEVRLFGRCDAEFFQPKYDEMFEKIKNYSEGWDTLGKLIDVKSGLLKIEDEKEYQYCELADIDSSLGTVGNYTKTLGKDLPSRARMKIEKNDVVVSSVAGSSKKVALITDDSKNLVASTGFFILRSKFFLPEVNLLLMKSFIYKEFLQRSARGMILSATIKDDFKNFPVPKLSKNLQTQIAQKITDSHFARKKSQTLLENAKKAVEIFVEADEEKAEEFLK